MNRAGSWIALLAASLALPAGAASEIVAGGIARAAVDFRITIPAVASLRLLNHPDAIEITADDIARGTLRVTGAALDLLVNNPRGYSLRAEVANAAFTAARIVNLPGMMPTMVGKPRPAPMQVEYELAIAPAAQPGRYAWPVSLSIQAP
jgi:hypothetical protein